MLASLAAVAATQQGALWLALPHGLGVLLLFQPARGRFEPPCPTTAAASHPWLQFVTDANGGLVELGQGHFAVVYLAHLLGAEVAVKVRPGAAVADAGPSGW